MLRFKVRDLERHWSENATMPPVDTCRPIRDFLLFEWSFIDVRDKPDMRLGQVLKFRKEGAKDATRRSGRTSDQTPRAPRT
jgi:hypothetical protein